MDTDSRLAELAAEVAAAPTPRAALRRLGELRDEVEAFERRQVARALAEGASFAAIARDLGLSRQAVHRRFRSLATEVSTLQTAPDVRRLLQCAREEAAAFGAGGVGSEHVVLAVLRLGDLPAAELLREAGVSLQRARMQVEGSTPRARLFRREPDPNGLITLLEGPARTARARGGSQIEVEDVLAGALEDPAGSAARTLRALGADPEEVRERLATSSRSADRRSRPSRS
jgi:ATP-dependent Clp protease ATP-binding subunit ClpA